MPKINYRYKSLAISAAPVKYDLMPIIPITISLKGKSINVEALIDSGANRCFCPLEIGEALGVQYSACPKEPVKGIGGAGDIYIHDLTIDIEHGIHKFKAAVGFGGFQLHGFSFILRQKDFFENVDILFKRRKETVELIIP